MFIECETIYTSMQK